MVSVHTFIPISSVSLDEHVEVAAHVSVVVFSAPSTSAVSMEKVGTPRSFRCCVLARAIELAGECTEIWQEASRRPVCTRTDLAGRRS
jgi:hypothetical protein